MNGTYVIYGILLFLCVILSAFFAVTETAFISLEKFRLQRMLEAKMRGATRVARILEKPERFLSSILLGNNLVNTAAAALATTLALSIRDNSASVAIATIIVTVVLLVFGDVGPKTFGNSYREKITLVLAHPVEAILWILAPFATVLSWIAVAFTRLMGGKPMPKILVEPEDIASMITVGHKEGTVEKNEAEMLHNVFDFGDRPVHEVIVPRTEVVAVEKGTRLSDFLSTYSTSPKSRYPVYEESMDNVIGVLSTKDVMMAIARDNISMDSCVDDLTRPAYFAPESKRISDLFQEMRDKNYHMGIIVDEYGGTAGIVSLSRLMEEIFGSVGNDLSAAEKEFESINEHTFQVDGSMRIDEANTEIALGLPEGDYETIAGFILHIMGRIPKQGQQIKYRDLKIVVTKMKGLKIEEVLIKRDKTPKDESFKDTF
ncbi:MAG: hemolysin family protein [Dehalococcoidia bacterium]|nr:hemolysin family protein [Dehalococcoidia bacterium]